jgi:cytosine/adenosine deaminase-related metal-dependent hydrolase
MWHKEERYHSKSVLSNVLPGIMARSILIKNGVVLIHDADNNVVPTKTDILVQNGKIAKLAEGIEATDVEVIDAIDKIISPGFVDTHHHGWQTQLKGRHANELLLQYMITGSYPTDTNFPPQPYSAT